MQVADIYAVWVVVEIFVAVVVVEVQICIIFSRVGRTAAAGGAAARLLGVKENLASLSLSSREEKKEGARECNKAIAPYRERVTL